MARGSGVVVGLFDAVFRPARLVATQTRQGRTSLRGQLGQLSTLTAVYLANVVLYAAPLTLAGVGVRGVGSPPPVLDRLPVADPATVWEFLVGLTVNSLTLLAGTVLTLLAVHVALVVTLQSRGFLRTAYSVVYSTSVYLAGMYTVVVFLSQAGTPVAAEIVLDVQRALFATVLDAMGSSLAPPGGRPDGFQFAGLSTPGAYALSALVLLACYYLYSLYLGTRINHRANRLTSLLVVGGVAASPVVYVVATVLAQNLPFVPKL